MIDSLETLERVMVLMKEHQIDELTFSGITLKKSLHVPAATTSPTATGHTALEKHLAPLPNEPWNAVSQEVADRWAETGRLDADSGGPEQT